MTWQDFILDIVIALAPILGAALIAAITYAAQYIRARHAWTRDLAVTAQAEASLKALVAEAQQTLVDGAKAANEDGKLTDDEAAQIKESVRLAFMRQLTSEQARVLSALTEDLGAWIGSRIEQFVVEQKQTDAERKIAALADPPSRSASP